MKVTPKLLTREAVHGDLTEVTYARYRHAKTIRVPRYVFLKGVQRDLHTHLALHLTRVVTHHTQTALELNLHKQHTGVGWGERGNGAAALSLSVGIGNLMCQ